MEDAQEPHLDFSVGQKLLHKPHIYSTAAAIQSTVSGVSPIPHSAVSAPHNQTGDILNSKGKGILFVYRSWTKINQDPKKVAIRARKFSGVGCRVSEFGVSTWGSDSSSSLEIARPPKN